MRRLALAVVAALLAVPIAHASDRHPTQAELEGEVMCPVCGTTLDQSNAPAAQQIKRVIARRIAAGDTKSQIKDRLVANYGESIRINERFSAELTALNLNNRYYLDPLSRSMLPAPGRTVRLSLTGKF